SHTLPLRVGIFGRDSYVLPGTPALDGRSDRTNKRRRKISQPSYTRPAANGSAVRLPAVGGGLGLDIRNGGIDLACPCHRQGDGLADVLRAQMMLEPCLMEQFRRLLPAAADEERAARGAHFV